MQYTTFGWRVDEYFMSLHCISPQSILCILTSWYCSSCLLILYARICWCAATCVLMFEISSLRRGWKIYCIVLKSGEKSNQGGYLCLKAWGESSLQQCQGTCAQALCLAHFVGGMVAEGTSPPSLKPCWHRVSTSFLRWFATRAGAGSLSLNPADGSSGNYTKLELARKWLYCYHAL